MTTFRSDDADIPCDRFVELVTDYLDDALAPEVMARIDGHLLECPGCAGVLAQFRESILLAGRLRDDDVARLDPQVRESLIGAFREAARARGDRS